jgi:ubiquinol-cytochrome c reductase iron-sulfur subunit
MMNHPYQTDKSILHRSRQKITHIGLMFLASLTMVASIIPFIRSWFPSESTKLTEAAVRVDISQLEPGQMMTALWQGKPVWILRRTKEMLNDLKKHHDELKDPFSLQSIQPEQFKTEYRSLNDEYFVVLGKCTHMGCIPIMKPDSGFICPCHGSIFDFSGRVLKGAPAPHNLIVPSYHFSADGKSITIGELV